MACCADRIGALDAGCSWQRRRLPNGRRFPTVSDLPHTPSASNRRGAPAYALPAAFISAVLIFDWTALTLRFVNTGRCERRLAEPAAEITQLTPYAKLNEYVWYSRFRFGRAGARDESGSPAHDGGNP